VNYYTENFNINYNIIKVFSYKDFLAQHLLYSINVGTNNVSSPKSVNTILSYYGDLIYKLKRMTRAKLNFTSILPRLVDHRDSEFEVCKVNAELREKKIYAVKLNMTQKTTI
jgi:hypothetical protein